MRNVQGVNDHPLWDKLKNKGATLSFDLELTARCNNNCRHCYINVPPGNAEAKAKELSPAEISQIADQAVQLGAVWSLLTGGEPLLRPDFEEIYLLLKRKGLLLSVFTNATLINEKHLALFSKYPPRDIEITVYGATQETYERITRLPGSYDMFVRGLDALISAGIKVRLKAMALKDNMHEMDLIAEFSRARTKDFYRFDPLLHLRYDGDPVRNEEIRAERLSPEEIIALEKSDPARLQALEKSCTDLLLADADHIHCNHLFHCGAGIGNFVVGYDGTFRLCSALVAPGTTYNLRTGTLADAIHNLVPQVRDMRSNKQEYLQSCRSCNLINLCLWCPAHAYLETGQLDGNTEYFCQVAHTRASSFIQPE